MYKNNNYLIMDKITFTLYPVYNRQGSGKIVLKHFVVHALQNFRDIGFEWRNLTPRFAHQSGEEI